jgi:hypothetical protein
MRKRKRSRFVTRGDLATLALGRMLYAAGLRQRTPTDDLIVSLTSFPPRIGKLHLVIQALLQQSLQPRKIVLYLSLEEFPERWIATFDDDRLYHRHCLAQLWDAAKAHPRTVVCAVARRLVVKDGQFLPYLEWRKVRSGAASFWLFPVGTYGILYPPGSLDPLVGNRMLFHDLAPDQDDIWFKAMSLKQNTPCLAVGGDGLMPLLEVENKNRLWTVNKVGNDVAWRRVLGHFGMTPATIATQEMQLNAGADTSRPA